MTSMVTALRWAAEKLHSFAEALRPSTGSNTGQFVDLAPTDKADNQGVYASAIKFATDNPNVSNIALTGPYGSGKSSIIRSFLKSYPRRALHISLAAFLSDATDKGDEGVRCKHEHTATKQEIERSILQQLLYGADADKLPLSRFKRIRSPGAWSLAKSVWVVAGLISLWYVFNRRSSLLDASYFQPFDLTNWFNFSVAGLAVAFAVSAIHHFYVASLGLSLKSISLRDVEINPSSTDEESILNRHLDEIIYFFQSTEYDLVIVEDLDRFKNADIFVTLRELNSLVNGNVGVKRQVRFLYALRDDMFANTDRTKFDPARP